MMNYIPFVLGFFILAISYPPALPFFLGYFLFGFGIATAMRKMALIHPKEQVVKYADSIFWWVFYTWPMAVATGIILIFKGK